MDLSILNFLNSLIGHYGLSEGVVVFFTTYFSYFFFLSFFIYLIFSKAYSKKDKKILASVTLLSAIASRYFVTEIIRFLYNRPRPFLVHDVMGLLDKTSFSFPSGHAMFIFAFAMALFMFNKRWGILFFIIGAITGIARIIAGVHYPSDILGGFLIGPGVSLGVIYLFRKYKNFLYNKNHV